MAPCFQSQTFLVKIFLFITLLLVPCIESLFSHHEECLALYLFKQGFPHPPFEASGFQKFDSWKLMNNASNDGSECCLWDGVVCSNEEEDGHVIGLDLSDRFLRGHINSSSTLFNLAHLQTLNLAMNDFTESQIPSQISRLKQLRTLNLSYTGISGQVPNEISHLIQLTSLDLSGNSLKLQSPSLEKLVQNLTGLEELHLSGVEIRSSVPRFLANFSSLRSIDLRNCLLQNEFPIAILQLPKLKFLNVAFNTNLTGFLLEFHNNSVLEHLHLESTGFSGIIPKSINNLNRLTFLGLANCFFSGHIPDSLANMTQLTLLDLIQNDFTGLVPSLAGLAELTVLRLSDSKFEKEGLPDWLGKMTNLNNLYLAGMNVYGEIPTFLANLTKLSFLLMVENSLFGRIPSSFMNLTQLNVIALGQNQLQGPISSSFSNFRSLQHLRLNDNNFSGKVELDWFLGLNKLQALIVGGNKISFVATNNYTNGTLPQLKFLDLSSCNLKEYPTFLRFQQNLTALQRQHFLPWVRLKTINLAYNLLQGQIPIPPPTTIAYDVSNNNLEGEIPPLLCEVKSLRVLYLSYNNITGILPPCFGTLSNSLLALNLKRNNLQGTMMNSFMQGNQLMSLDLSENQFMGQVSKSLTNCTNLELLSLGDNSFDGFFPFWLETLRELKVLILRSNKFYGEIHGPTNVTSLFPKLRIIDLSNNRFSGPLPHKYLQSWNAMKSVRVGKSSIMDFAVYFEGFHWSFAYSMTITIKGFKREYDHILKIFTAIDLSCNNFEGEIPQSLQDLRGIESLNLSNNHLTGHVLTSLGNLKNLESLDLSQNKLSGEIPQQLLQLDFLAIFNVSFNDLDGRIPQGKQFNTFENNSYMGNLELCGKPLSKECQNSKASTPPQRSNSKPESFFPSERVDWIVIFCGVGSGLLVGIVLGNFLYVRHSDWFIERFGMRKDKWVKPLSNKRRNQAL